MIRWIQDGGDLSLKDRNGDSPLKLVVKAALVSVKENEKNPGWVGTSAILLGLDKRPCFPSRIMQNGVFDNPEELKEITSNNSVLFRELQNKEQTLKTSYKLDTIAYRAFRELLFENGADVNDELQTEAGGTLGHLFAMEAANRNELRHYLRLIHWIRNGGDVNKKDRMGCTPGQRLYGYATYPECSVKFPGIIATLSILANVEGDKINDPAAKTDSRNPKYDPYPSKWYGASKADNMPTFDIKEGYENMLKKTYKDKILQTLSDGGLNIKAIAKAPMTYKMRLFMPDEQNRQQVDKNVVDYLSKNENNSSSTTSTTTTTTSSNNNNNNIDTIMSSPVLMRNLSQRKHSVFEANAKREEKAKREEEIQSLNRVIHDLVEEQDKFKIILNENSDELQNKEVKLKEFDAARLKAEKDLKDQKLQLDKIKSDIVEIEDITMCPILMVRMTDPWMTPDGHSYEKSAIVEWVQAHGTSPLSMTKVTLEQIRPNIALRKIIEQLSKAEQQQK